MNGPKLRQEKLQSSIDRIVKIKVNGDFVWQKVTFRILLECFQNENSIILLRGYASYNLYNADLIIVSTFLNGRINFWTRFLRTKYVSKRFGWTTIFKAIRMFILKTRLLASCEKKWTKRKFTLNSCISFNTCFTSMIIQSKSSAAITEQIVCRR